VNRLPNTLVLGGARSGKSRFAERLVEDCGLQRTYLATATVGDEEMRMRIENHRISRGCEWTTIEESLDIVAVLVRESLKDRVVLVDCLTLWLSNLMHAGRDTPAEIARLIAFLEVSRCGIVFVSNEVGMGIVPENPLGRAFRDAQGRLNESVAAAVTRVALVAAGLPLWLKN
jgi:adenosylcobinamide kinase/adenosylcobinamide-phosphate guanylyltransferase